ncbi:hypothetical protein NM688_g4763 [Phlebia brevispora]|uniref:Uncharacterized protein n=1 Tax=Phlebia brevispora TaxID=194682 RepID=A0ACC1T238_9APHY|nr:hypothetical protein NM688_g4763 [Phlebia brevispora]
MRCFLARRWATCRLHSTQAVKPLPVKLRPYQEYCLEACTDALSSGVSRIGVSLPTGSGKTTVFITLLSLIQPPVGHSIANRALVIVNSIELARQAAAHAERLFPHWTVEIEQGAKHKASGRADLTIATYQTLLRSQRLGKFDPRYLKAIIVDEAHHAAAPSYRRILSRFSDAVRSPDKTLPPPVLTHKIPILGFSATFSRHDGLALGSVFEQIVYHQDFLQMIKDQWLCNVRFTCVRANIDLTNVTVNAKTGDFNATSLAHVINTPTVNRLIVQTWLDRAASRRSTLVFCVNIAHIHDLTNTFREVGVDARYVYADTPAAERRALIEGFRQGAYPVLLNCAILTEGADIPNIDCVLVARPTRSRNVFAQMIGRGMRLSPATGKDDCHIIDFVDSNSRVPGVVSIPTLFGLDPSEVIDDETVASLEERRAQTVDIPELSSSQDSLDDVPDPSRSGAPHVRRLSTYAWVGCGGDVYILECLGRGYIRIEPSANDGGEARYVAIYTPATLPAQTAFTLKISPFQRNRHILTAKTLSDAVKGADTYAKMKVVKGAMVQGLLRTAKWRQQPATENQKAFIRKRWIKRKVLVEDFENEDTLKKIKNIEKLTKGEAANIIVRIKHGAVSRHVKKLKTVMKANEKVARETQRRAREHVAVGPLPVPAEAAM